MIFYLVSKKMMISAGEISGELYGAMLSREIKKNWPDVEIFGIGGTRMKAEGVKIIAPISQILGIVEAIKHLLEVKKTFRKATQFLISQKPDILVLIDYPDFNIALAKKAKAIGIPILYYVSPQVWAWRRGRIKKIASLVNKVAVLFPFEVDYYKSTGLPCEFVGHPIAETININQSKEDLKHNLDLDPHKDVITLLPGSRPNEISRHQTIIREVAEKIHHEFPEVQVVIPLVSGSKLTEVFPDYVKVIYGRTTEAIACSEAAAVASGTATLETALVGTPLVVFYKISPITFYFAKLLTSVKFISLVNILSGKKVVEELLQKDANAEKIFHELKKILTNVSYREAIVSNLTKIQKMMQGKKPSSRVASIVGEIAGWNNINGG
jgi:lipid-A-disaccharide synthase